jgi:hypothetical protein
VLYTDYNRTVMFLVCNTDIISCVHCFHLRIFLQQSHAVHTIHIAVIFTIKLQSPPPHGATAPSGLGSPHYRGFTITLRRITPGRCPLDEWSARRRDLYRTTQNTTDRYRCPGKIRTHHPSKRAAADPRLCCWVTQQWKYYRLFSFVLRMKFSFIKR